MATTSKARNNAYMELYRAVVKYVELRGGKVLVCGGIQIQEWPDTGKFSFTVGVKCTGRKPKYVEKEQL